MRIVRSAPLFLLLGLIPAGVAAAWTHSPTQNLPVSTAANAQTAPQVVLDGAGGAIVVWQDARGGAGTDDIYAQHVLASGALDPAWPAGGLLVCGAANSQSGPLVVTDAFGGAIVVWQDFRNGTESKVYARRVLASGVNDPAWPADGRALCGAAGNQYTPAIVPDGAGGAIVTWQDYRSGTADLYATHVQANGALDGAWPVNGTAVVAITGVQANPAIVPDYAGGVIIAWDDTRASSSPDIYAQHLLATGAPDAAWPANGRLVADGASVPFVGPMLATDGAGGAIVGWSYGGFGFGGAVAQHVLASGVVDPAWPVPGRVFTFTSTAGGLLAGLVPDWSGGAIAVLTELVTTSNNDLVVHHVLGTGVLDPAWPVNGRALSRAAGHQQEAKAVFDGAGGAFVTWRDFRSGTTADVYAHRVLAGGILDPAWPAEGRPVCTAAADQFQPAIAPDLAGGVVIAWTDARSGNSDIYAQNVTTFGVLGDPEPAIVSIDDLPNDQGGRVRLRWNASQMDDAPFYEIGSYAVWRQVTEATAQQALARGARLAAADGIGPVERGVYRALRTATATTWWEGVGTVNARGEPWYTFVAETFRDSSAAGNPPTTFRVEARAALQIGWWDSAPDSGYSVDNLAPAAPAPFTGQYLAGTAHLHWNPNAEHDLAGYRLYRGASSSFVPGPGNLVASLADTGYADAAGQKYVYKLTAVDLHGNESPVATLEFPGPTGVGDEVATRELSFAVPMPNPAGARSTLRYGLPRAAHVRLAVYDASGRLVRELASGMRAAGDHAESWDLGDAAGRAVGAGLYFARLEAEGRHLVRRIAVAR